MALPAGNELVGLSTVLESLLFVAGEPVDISHLAKSLDLEPSTVEDGLARLAEHYKQRAGGLRLQVHNGRYQLVTAPSTARFVEDFLNLDFSTKLSSAALETLAIVAYRQPVTRFRSRQFAAWIAPAYCARWSHAVLSRKWAAWTRWVARSCTA